MQKITTFQKFKQRLTEENPIPTDDTISGHDIWNVERKINQPLPPVLIFPDFEKEFILTQLKRNFLRIKPQRLKT